MKAKHSKTARHCKGVTSNPKQGKHRQSKESKAQQGLGKVRAKAMKRKTIMQGRSAR